MADATDIRRPRGRPPQLSRERIVEAVLATGNLDTLTMRELATGLGVTHRALYRWVANRDELFDLISDVVTDRVLDDDERGDLPWQARLGRIGRAMHDEFLAVPGFATHVSRPHAHHARSHERLRRAITGAFLDAGAPAEQAEQSWFVFVTSVIGWLAVRERPTDGPDVPFDAFLDVLLRGLPVR